MSALLDQRKAADYDIDEEFTPDDAHDRIKEAEEALAIVDSLSDDKIRDIANRI